LNTKKFFSMFITIVVVGVLIFVFYNYRYSETTVPDISKETYNFSTLDSLTSGYIYILEGDKQVRIDLIEGEANSIVEALKEEVIIGTDEAFSSSSEPIYLISLEDPTSQNENITFSIFHDLSENVIIIEPFIEDLFKPNLYISKTDQLYRTMKKIIEAKAIN